MEAQLERIAAGLDPVAKVAEYRQVVADCMFSGADLAEQLGKTVEHLLVAKEHEPAPASAAELHARRLLAAQVSRVARKSTLVPAAERAEWSIPRCLKAVGLDSGRLEARNVSRRKAEVDSVELTSLEALPAIIKILNLQARGAAAAAGAAATGGTAAGAGSGSGAGAGAHAMQVDGAEAGVIICASLEPTLRALNRRSIDDPSRASCVRCDALNVSRFECLSSRG